MLLKSTKEVYSEQCDAVVALFIRVRMYLEQLRQYLYGVMSFSLRSSDKFTLRWFSIERLLERSYFWITLHKILLKWGFDKVLQDVTLTRFHTFKSFTLQSKRHLLKIFICKIVTKAVQLCHPEKTLCVRISTSQPCREGEN